MTILYDLEPTLAVWEFHDVLKRSTLDQRRPGDLQVLEQMLRGATAIVTARDGGLLVGVSRAISDGSYCTYLSDLAVDVAYQSRGIGRELIAKTHQHCGLESSLILLAAPGAATYYPHIGMQRHDSCWMIPPKKSSTQSNSSRSEEAGEVNDQASSSPNAWDTSGNAGEFFDQMAEEYNSTIHRCFPRYNEMLDSVLRYLPVDLAPRRILDLGTGTGNLAIRVCKQYPDAQLHCVDLSPESLDVCRRQLKSVAPTTSVHYQCADITKLAFDEDEFDLIVSSIAIHHLASEDKRRLFADCRKWLRPGGVLCFADQFRGETEQLYQQHIDGWKELSFRAGTNQAEWDAWMEHQRDHDHHETLSDVTAWLGEADFSKVDTLWRFLLWSIVYAE